MLVKEKIHKIIEEIEDEQTLNGFLSLITSLRNEQQGQLFKSLTKEQKEELQFSYDESFDSNNLIQHSKVKREHSKWL
ncbi:hypothetical protein [Portibacter lacus]|uniref:Uncharacterized protein n=1 Tax=Portibacter lacus TaxID=1099794 RepID=A0AA37WGX6_9BACT|nr:hypothetical protein [Portibacter lacus]GLR18255.1 hypothetical protein GCM10007940_28710 [Portibacter lacus]